MQLDRLLTKTMSRLAKSGIAGLRQSPEPVLAGKAGAPAPKSDDLRGSGSWANEWGGAKSAIARAKALAVPGQTGKKHDAFHGTLQVRPLMSVQDVKLYNWIADRMEAEAPTCSLHSGVALHAFLNSTGAHDGSDPLDGLVVDMLIADENGQPVAALIHETATNPPRQLLLIDALIDADLPIVDIPARPSLAALWHAISDALPEA